MTQKSSSYDFCLFTPLTHPPFNNYSVNNCMYVCMYLNANRYDTHLQAQSYNKTKHVHMSCQLIISWNSKKL